MSHILEARTQIQIAQTRQERESQIGLLRRALSVLATRYQGAVTEHYFDYGYQHRESTIRLALVIGDRHTPDALLPRGIGLAEGSGGELIFIGDSYHHEAFYQQIQAEILHQYTVLASKEALSTLSYDQVLSYTLDTTITDLVGMAVI